LAELILEVVSGTDQYEIVYMEENLGNPVVTQVEARITI
jgi:hypothetical protein